MFMHSEKSFASARIIRPAALSGLPFAAGMVAGSLVETPTGWTPVERLCEGMEVLTYDGGALPVTAVRRAAPNPDYWAGPEAGLVRVPGGALDNCEDLLLLPDQPVLIHAAAAEAVLGARAVLVPAAAFDGHRGIHRVVPDARVELVALAFATEEMVFVNSGTLLHCPADTFGPGAAPECGTLVDGFFPMLGRTQAEALLGLIDAGALCTADLARAA